MFLKLLSLKALAAVGDNYTSGISASLSTNFSFLERWLDLNLEIGIALVIVYSSMQSNLGESVYAFANSERFLFAAYFKSALFG